MMIPRNVQSVWNTLNLEGLKVYLCGGAVRDSLLGRTIKDWDFYIHATSERFLQICDKYGFKVVVKSGTPLEEYVSNEELEWVFEDVNNDIQYMLINTPFSNKIIDDFGTSLSQAYFDGENVILRPAFVASLQTKVIKYKNTDKVRLKYLDKIKSYFPEYRFERE